ncbi:hypothetical protein ES708_23566 [subsurface metagenome]
MDKDTILAQAKVPKGKKVIWYEPYTYKNKAGKQINVRGHFKER